jgi:integrase
MILGGLLVGYVTAKVGKKGKTRYTAMYRDLTGAPRSAGTFDSEETARRRANTAEEDSRKGRAADPRRSRVRLRTYVSEDWLAHHVMEDTTREGYVYLLNRYLLPELGDRRLRDIDPAVVREWITRLGKVHGAKPPTIRAVKVLFDAIMTTVVNDRILPYHPGRGLKTPPVARKPQHIITAEDYELLHESLPNPQMQLLVECDIETGLRWGELTELRPKDINFTTGILTVSRVVVRLHARTEKDAPRFKVKNYPKDKEWRQLKLAAHLLVKLSSHIAQQGLQPDDLLFPLPEPTGPARRRRPESLPDPLTLGFTEPNDKGRTYRHGTPTAYQAGPCRCDHCKDAVAAYRAARRAQGKDRPCTPRTVSTDADRHLPNDWFRRNVWNKALDQANLGYRITPHGLRHAHASWLLAGGANLQVVKERLGHGSITTTEKYLHSLPTRHDEALAALDNIRKAAPAQETSAQRRPHPGSASGPVPGTAGDAADPTAILASLGPDVVRQVLTSLLLQQTEASAQPGTQA